MDLCFSDGTIEISKQITKVSDELLTVECDIFLLTTKEWWHIRNGDTNTSTNTGLLIMMPTNN